VGLDPVAPFQIQATRHVGRGGRGCCPFGIAVGDADYKGAGLIAGLLTPGRRILPAGEQILDPHRDLTLLITLPC
jgi:hypothetical protein